MHMEKTHQAIIQGRKDQAQRAARQGWDRALHKDPALLEHQQGQAVIKYNTNFSNDQLSQAGHFGNPVFPRGHRRKHRNQVPVLPFLISPKAKLKGGAC